MRNFPMLAVVLLCSAVTASPAQPPTKGKDGWGTVHGRVVLEGPIPPPRLVNAPAGLVAADDWGVDPTSKGICWVFVWLEAKEGQALPVHPDLVKLTAKEVVIDLAGFRYTPNAAGMREGQALVVKNTNAEACNLMWRGLSPNNPGGNIVILPGTASSVTDLAADKLPVALTDNLHPWMSGWVRVFNHPYFAVTDADGRFVIRNAPAGEWRLKVWHPRGGYAQGGRQGTPVMVRDRGQAEFTFSLKAH